MLQEAISKFQVMAPLLLPSVIDLSLMDDVIIYDDYALLSFSLPRSFSLEEMMDMFEDKMELIILYHLIPSDATVFGHACCAYSNPNSERMFKMNVRTDPNGLVSKLTVTIYDSLEFMSSDVLLDMHLNEGHGKFKYQRDVGQIVNDFS